MFLFACPAGSRMLDAAAKDTPRGFLWAWLKTGAYCVCHNATFGPRITPACA